MSGCRRHARAPRQGAAAIPGQHLQGDVQSRHVVSTRSLLRPSLSARPRVLLCLRFDRCGAKKAPRISCVRRPAARRALRARSGGSLDFTFPGIGRYGKPPPASWQGVGYRRWRPPPPIRFSNRACSIEAGVPDARTRYNRNCINRKHSLIRGRPGAWQCRNSGTGHRKAPLPVVCAGEFPPGRLSLLKIGPRPGCGSGPNACHAPAGEDRDSSAAI